jgi:hypothetical protein
MLLLSSIWQEGMTTQLLPKFFHGSWWRADRDRHQNNFWQVCPFNFSPSLCPSLHSTTRFRFWSSTFVFSSLLPTPEIDFVWRQEIDSVGFSLFQMVLLFIFLARSDLLILRFSRSRLEFHSQSLFAWSYSFASSSAEWCFILVFFFLNKKSPLLLILKSLNRVSSRHGTKL